MLELLGPFLIGIAGSLHCLGMCGPIILAYSLHETKAVSGLNSVRIGLFHHLVFHLGRLSSYMLLGAAAGVLAQLVNLEIFMGQLRVWVSLGGGAVLVLMGLVLLGYIPLPGWARGDSGSVRRVSKWIEDSSFGGRMALGMATGFLPCILPWAMMVQAASSGGVWEALSIMGLFGLGTVPALVVLGVSATAVSFRLRLAGERIAALGVIFMGGLLFYKGATALLGFQGLAGCCWTFPGT